MITASPTRAPLLNTAQRDVLSAIDGGQFSPEDLAAHPDLSALDPSLIAVTVRILARRDLILGDPLELTHAGTRAIRHHRLLSELDLSGQRGPRFP